MVLLQILLWLLSNNIKASYFSLCFLIYKYGIYQIHFLLDSCKEVRYENLFQLLAHSSHFKIVAIMVHYKMYIHRYIDIQALYR